MKFVFFRSRGPWSATIVGCLLFLFSAGIGRAEGRSATIQAIVIKQAWTRATIEGQRHAAIFLTLLSDTRATLIAASSPMARRVALQEVTVQEGVMRSRLIPSLELLAGRELILKAGGPHLVLTDLLHNLRAGEGVPLTLVFLSAGKTQTITTEVPVYSAATLSAP
ncbi:copper chaperone PCu(A)C [Parvibium lacunae]|nr:copper chaperone PCu(A)C [Parvibium lacunae]